MKKIIAVLLSVVLCLSTGLAAMADTLTDLGGLLGNSFGSLVDALQNGANTLCLGVSGTNSMTLKGQCGENGLGLSLIMGEGEDASQMDVQFTTECVKLNMGGMAMGLSYSELLQLGLEMLASAKAEPVIEEEPAIEEEPIITETRSIDLWKAIEVTLDGTALLFSDAELIANAIVSQAVTTTSVDEKGWNATTLTMPVKETVEALLAVGDTLAADEGHVNFFCGLTELVNGVEADKDVVSASLQDSWSSLKSLLQSSLEMLGTCSLQLTQAIDPDETGVELSAAVLLNETAYVYAEGTFVSTGDKSFSMSSLISLMGMSMFQFSMDTAFNEENHLSYLSEQVTTYDGSTVTALLEDDVFTVKQGEDFVLALTWVMADENTFILGGSSALEGLPQTMQLTIAGLEGGLGMELVCDEQTAGLSVQALTEEPIVVAEEEIEWLTAEDLKALLGFAE